MKLSPLPVIFSRKGFQVNLIIFFIFIFIYYAIDYNKCIQDRINKKILKFHEKKEAMMIDEDSFPPVASINTIAFDLRALIDSKKARGLPLSPKIRSV